MCGWNGESTCHDRCSGACQRAVELSVELVTKGTKRDAAYDRDPTGHPDETRFDTVSYDEVLRHGLEIMDSSAIEFSKSHAMLTLLSET